MTTVITAGAASGDAGDGDGFRSAGAVMTMLSGSAPIEPGDTATVGGLRRARPILPFHVDRPADPDAARRWVSGLPAGVDVLT